MRVKGLQRIYAATLVAVLVALNEKLKSKNERGVAWWPGLEFTIRKAAGSGDVLLV